MEEKSTIMEFERYHKEINQLTNEVLNTVPAAMVRPVLAELHNAVASLAQQQLAAELQRMEEKPQTPAETEREGE